MYIKLLKPVVVKATGFFVSGFGEKERFEECLARRKYWIILNIALSNICSV
jgi:hypothetical protein